MVAPLYGDLFKLAYFFVDVLAGSPPQRQSVILDTGSSLLGFPCHGCTKCGEHIDLKFDLQASTTGSWLSCGSSKCHESCGLSATDRNKCRYSQHYAEGSSINGFFVSDVISIAGKSNKGITYDYIGCHMVETNLFTSQKAAGIVGVSFRRRQTQPTLMDELFTVVQNKIFSVCFSEEGGELTVGGYTKQQHKVDTSGSSKVQWVDVTSARSYSVSLTKIEINGKLAGNGQRDFGNAVVDSGTTYTYLPSGPHDVIRSTLVALCTAENDCAMSSENLPCWVVNDEKNFPAFLPIMKVSFGAVTVDWQPHSYLYLAKNNRWCLGIAREHSTATVLGMTFFKQKHIIFDIGKNRIGFVEASCPTFTMAKRSGISGDEKQMAPPPAADVPTASPQVTQGDFTIIQKVTTATSRTPDFSPTAVYALLVTATGLLLSAVLVVIGHTLRTPPPTYSTLTEQPQGHTPTSSRRRRLGRGDEDVELYTTNAPEQHQTSSVATIDVELPDARSSRLGSVRTDFSSDSDSSVCYSSSPSSSEDQSSRHSSHHLI
eukprot:GHVS01068963.1.p1 GENE.GHVS01068963.1~~GHVS01068963.1.p1  ORF type:complete len:544 (-),score=92.53 GHVS01068963.1:89-1720(-)